VSGNARARLLDAVIEYAAGNGIADVSLRQLAAAVGTSHRMLIHHFGSKEGLLVAVVQAVEEQQREELERLRAQIDDPQEVARQLWARLVDPELEPFERLFFELYGQALQGRTWAAPLLDEVVTTWLPALRDLMSAGAGDPATAATDARLGLAVTRGLLLDLLTTGDRVAVDEAMERFRDLYRDEPASG
jgi:AcrR family transcriptional regulator